MPKRQRRVPASRLLCLAYRGTLFFIERINLFIFDNGSWSQSWQALPCWHESVLSILGRSSYVDSSSFRADPNLCKSGTSKTPHHFSQTMDMPTIFLNHGHPSLSSLSSGLSKKSYMRAVLFLFPVSDARPQTPETTEQYVVP